MTLGYTMLAGSMLGYEVDEVVQRITPRNAWSRIDPPGGPFAWER